MSNLTIITQIATSRALSACVAPQHGQGPRERSVIDGIPMSGKTSTTGAFAYRTFDPGSPTCRPPA